MRCEHLHDSAVYVLGALSPPEREAYERHLADCAECRAEVAEFSDLPGLLGRLDPEVAAQIALASDPPEAARPRWAGPTAAPADLDDPELLAADRWAGPTMSAPAPQRINGAPVDPLLPRVLDRARTARRTERRRRRVATAATALVAAFLAVLAVVGVRAIGFGEPSFEAMREVAATVPVQASLALSAATDGTTVVMRCSYKDGEGDEYAKWTYKLVVVPKSGDPEEIDTWTARSGDHMELTAHSDIARSNIARVEIRKGDGTPLLSLAT